MVFADKEKDADAWYNAYKSFDRTDDDGNVMNIGGSRSFNIADMAAYTGVSGGSDKYKQIYTTFGNISKEAYPEVISAYPDYSEAVDWTYLKAVYNKFKGTSNEGKVSKADYTTSQKGALIGDAAYNIEFATGSATILPSSYATLDRIVGLLSAADNTYVDLTGYTDNVGDPTANLTLSKERASAVAFYLKQKNSDLSDASKLTFKGLGEENPIADNSTAAGKAKNRRVEIKLYKVKQ